MLGEFSELDQYGGKMSELRKELKCTTRD
jgi:hypothetical protein